MTFFQLSIGLIILFSMVVRPFLYKPCAQYFPAELSVAFTSVWLMAGLAVSWPVFGHLLTDDFKAIMTSPYLLFSLLKGVLLWFMIKLQQLVNRESTSSSVFFGFVAMALGSLVNNIFFKEGLLPFQLSCISLLGLLGLFFVLRGDARRLSLAGKINFVAIIVLGASFSVFDHLAIYLACLFRGISKQDYRNIFCNRQVVAAGIAYTASEFLIIYTSVNLLPVSFVAMFMRLAAPVVMLVSAVRYHEQSVKNQLVFGLLALLFALPLIFIKS